MGLIVRFFSFLIVLGVAGLFFIKKPDGTPWLSLDDFAPDTRSIKRSINDALPEQVVGGGLSDSVSVYKWKDAEGNWQYSDKPPEGGTAQQVLVGTDVNRDLAPVPLPSSNRTAQPQQKGKAILIKDSGGFSPTTISPEKIPTLINDAKDVQALMNNRQQQLDEALKK